jgi:hypothetical protein
MIYTSRSQLESWQACPRKYYLEYVLEGGLDLDMSATALNIGSAVHGAVEQILRAQQEFGPDQDSLLALGLTAAAASPEYATLESQDDRDLVTALVRTWWAEGLPVLRGWKVEDVEREEVFDFHTGLGYKHTEADHEMVRFQSRSDLIARAPDPVHDPVGRALNGLAVAPGLYNWNLKTWRSCGPACGGGKCGWCRGCRQRALHTDAQTFTELLGAEKRLGEQFMGVVYQILVKEDHPLVWNFRNPATGQSFLQRSWHCHASHENTHKKKPDLCTGDKWHKLPNDFERVPVRDQPGGQAAHFERIRAEEPELLKDYHVILGPMARPSDYLMEEWVDMWLPRAAALDGAAIDAEKLRRAGNPEALERHLRSQWPKHTAHGNCVKMYGGRCPAFSICHAGADPSGWPVRVANHPKEGLK